MFASISPFVATRHNSCHVLSIFLMTCILSNRPEILHQTYIFTPTTKHGQIYCLDIKETNLEDNSKLANS